VYTYRFGAKIGYSSKDVSFFSGGLFLMHHVNVYQCCQLLSCTYTVTVKLDDDDDDDVDVDGMIQTCCFVLL